MRHINLRFFIAIILIGLFIAVNAFGASPVFATGTRSVTIPPSATNADLVANNPAKTSNFECADVKGELDQYGNLYPFSSWPYDALNSAKRDGQPPSSWTSIAPLTGAPSGVSSPYIKVKGTSTSLDWTSNFGIDLVLVKGGSKGTNIYIYLPSGTSGSGLKTPDGSAISNVKFCWDNPVTVKVDKVTNPNSLDDTDFSFTLKVPNYQKDGSAFSENFLWSDNDGYKYFYDLPKGNFDLNENLTSSQDSQFATSVVCTLKRNGSTSTIVNSSEDETIDLDSLKGGDYVFCTFTNTASNPTGKIKVIKKNTSDVKLAGWTFKATNKTTGTEYTSASATDANGEAYILNLPYGTYKVCEVLQSGWVAVDPSNGCKDNVVVDANSGNGATTQTGGGSYDYLTFKNKQVRDLIVYKKDPSGNILGSWEFKLRKYGSDTVLQTKTTTTGNPVTFTNLDVGVKYVVCETKKSGWTTQSPTDSNGCQSITIPGTGEVKLTFVNKPPTRNIYVKKTDKNGNKLKDWEFKATNKDNTNLVYGPVKTNSEGVATFENLPFGNYRICETMQSGWVAVDPASGCRDIVVDANTPQSAAQTSESVTTQTGTYYTNWYYFKNEYQVRKIKLYKYKKDGSTISPLSGWTFTATNKATKVVYTSAATNSSGWTYIYDLPFGDYTVCEVLQSGWTPVEPNSTGCTDITINASTPNAISTEEVSTQTGGGSGTYTLYFKNRQATPSIEIKKYTNGKDADDPNGGASPNDVPLISPNAVVTWTYIVHNNGEVPFAKADITVTDDQTTTKPSFTGYYSGDTDDFLEPGEKWLYTLKGTALNLKYGMSGATIVDGCKTSDSYKYVRPVYKNIGKVQIKNGVSDTDPSHYCNPEDPKIKIIKYTNNKDANDPFGDVPTVDINGLVTWKYEIFNIGNIPFNKDKVSVTDDRPGVTPTYSSGDAGIIGVFEPGEKWIYTATGNAFDLTKVEYQNYVVPGCKVNDVSRPTYKNTGTLKVTYTTVLTATDPSHYCNTPKPGIDIKKFTNGMDADSANGNDVPRIKAGDPVTWTYLVTNTGNVSFLETNVQVTDDQPGVTVLTPPTRVQGKNNGDNYFDPGEQLLFTAKGTALELNFQMSTPKVVQGCKTSDGYPRPVYENKGTVKISGGDPKDWDLSHYCNPENPQVKIIKYTNNQDANDPNGNDVPKIAVGQTVTWKYEIENTGNVPFTHTKVSVTDNRAGVTPVYQSGDDGDKIFEPGEKWIYTASATVVQLQIGPSQPASVAGCGDGRATYNNTGTLTVINSPTNLVVSDPSHYCHPAGKNIDIKKYTNTFDADSPDANVNPVPKIEPGQPVTWTYIVSNTSTGGERILIADIVVTDDQPNVIVTGPVKVGTHNPDDAYLDPGEKLLFTAYGQAKVLTFGMPNTTIVNGCYTQHGQPRPVYENKGTVTVTNGPSDWDLSHYCNPEKPSIEIKKYTNGYDADARSGGVPEVDAGSTVVWTYIISNTGNVPFPINKIVITDSVIAGFMPLDPVNGKLFGNADDVLEPGERWQYKVTGPALNLVSPGGIYSYIVDGCQTGEGVNRPTYENYGFVYVSDYKLEDNDPSHYCNTKTPGIDIKKYTNGYDADSADSAVNTVPEIEPGAAVTWTYIVSNTGNVPWLQTSIVVTDDQPGVVVGAAVQVPGKNDGDAFFEPGEQLLFTATGLAKVLTFNMVDGTKTVAGCMTAAPQEQARPVYENKGTVRVNITGGLTDWDPSHYCNPEKPGIDIKKYTNGADADTANGNDVPKIVPGAPVTWTYVVTNTGNVPFAKEKISVTDDRGVTPVYNGPDLVLDPGEVWIYQATGSLAVKLVEGQPYVVPGCAVNQVERPTYKNTGLVTINYTTILTDSDPSHYCNPMVPGISIKKYTNGEDADFPTGPHIPLGEQVTWTYKVTNTGNVPLANVVVTDNIAGVTPLYVSGDTNLNNKLDLTEEWIFTAQGVAIAGQYANTGYTKGTPPEGPDVTDNDPSHYYGDTTALGDYVWEDRNEDGIQDPGEPPVPGVKVYLLNETCTEVMPGVPFTTTNNLGIYGFHNLTPGTYCVQFELPSGYAFTKRDTPSDDAKDSDADPSTGKTIPVTLEAGKPNLTLDAGLVKIPSAALGNFVWDDLNYNGVQDPGEPPVPNIPVKLYKVDEQGLCTIDTSMTDTTDGDGSYLFEKLYPGNYCVQFDISSKPNYNYTVKNSPAGNFETDSDPDPTTGKTPITNLSDGETDLTLDAGIVLKKIIVDAKPLCINDATYLEYKVTAMGFNPGDIGPNPVKIHWLDVQDNNNVITTTLNLPIDDGKGNPTKVLWPGAGVDAQGRGNKWPGWSFEGGVWVQQATNLRPVVDIEFEVNPTALVDNVQYPPSSPFCITDAPAALGDRVWYDVNKNGLQDEGEAGVPGVKVTLFNSEGAQVGSPLFTDGNGNYLFTMLFATTYYVVFDPATLPPGFTFTQILDPVNETSGSDAGPTGATHSVPLAAGQTYLHLDAGIVAPTQPGLAALGDTVWFDANKNGLQDFNEVGVPNVVVKLFAAGGTSPIRETVTSAAGKYLFDNLQPGSYFVQFVGPAGYSFTHYNVNGNGQDVSDSDAKSSWVDVSISDGGVEAKLGEPLALTVFYTNTDTTLKAENVVITKTIPEGTTFVPSSSDSNWSCTSNDPGGVCMLALPVLEPGQKGSFTFTILLSISAAAVPDVLDIHAGVSHVVTAETDIVELSENETDLTVDAGLVILQALFSTPTPTNPTNLPDGEQPNQRDSVFLPTIGK